MIRMWIEAMRLRTLPVSIAGVLAGCGCAAWQGKLSFLPAILCLLFAMVAQIASNFGNEYYDFKNGVDRKGREGFRRGVTEGDISPDAMKRATFTMLGLAAIIGCSLLCFGGLWLIPVGLAILLFALAYSAGPYPLSHHGLGDVTVIVFFGIIPVTLTCYLQTGEWKNLTELICTSVAIGILAANVLVVKKGMKKNKNQLLRLQTLIENDRITTGENFSEMLVCDVDKLLRDYFDFSLSPTISMEKSNNGYLVNISINALRIKSFANIQK